MQIHSNIPTVSIYLIRVNKVNVHYQHLCLLFLIVNPHHITRFQLRTHTAMFLVKSSCTVLTFSLPFIMHSSI